MTCIVGVESDNHVYMGGDSAAVEGINIRLTTTPKVFKKGSLLIGYTWSFRMGQIIQYSNNVPEIPEEKDNYSYLAQDFVTFIRKIFQESGFMRVESAREEGGQFMVGIRGELFTIESDFSVLRNIDGFDAIGCGASYALGALRVMCKYPGITALPRTSMEIALQTAAYFSNSVSEPFIYEVG